MSRSTVKRRLKEQGIKNWLAAKRPRLEAQHAKLRLEWSLEYRDWTRKRIIWSDECSVEKSADPQQVWVFRTPEEKWHKDCINDTVKSGETKLMVWGCFAGGIRGNLVPIHE